MYKYYFLLSIIFISCNTKPKFFSKRDNDGDIMKGEVINDSIFNGIVKYYDSLNNYKGYATFTYGFQNGPSVHYYDNGKLSDSINYINDAGNGFAYNYDSTGKLIGKVFLYQNRSVGHYYIYDSIGNIIEYYFKTLEGEIIYNSKTINKTDYETGSRVNLRVTDIVYNNEHRDLLFLYLVLHHHLKVHYALAVLDAANKIISTEDIDSQNQFFYEKTLDILPKGESYAVIEYMYNPFKKRDDVEITKLHTGDVYGFSLKKH